MAQLRAVTRVGSVASAALAVPIALGACTESTPSEQADDAYISQLDVGAGLSVRPAEDLIALGHETCGRLEDGTPRAEVVGALTARDPLVIPSEWDTLVDAAHRHYCPGAPLR